MECKKIEQQAQLLEAVLDALPYPLYVLDAKTYNILLANSAVNFDKHSDKKTCYAITHRRDAPCHLDKNHTCPLETVKKTKKPTIVEHIHYDKYDNPRYFEVHGHPIFDDEGNVAQMLEFSIDITEKKLIEMAMEKNKKRIQEITDKSAGGLLAIDDTNTVRFVNNKAKCFLGKDEKDLVGKKIDVNFSKKNGSEIEIVRENKSKGVGEISTVELLWKDLFVSLIFIQDVTERKESERLIKAERARGELFMDLLSHDINNLNLPIMNYMELFLLKKELPEMYQNAAKTVLKQSKAITRLIESVKRYSQLHPDEFDTQPMDITPLLQHSQERIKNVYKDKKITITSTIKEKEVIVSGNDFLQDVFDNVIGNAVKYNKTDHVTITITHSLADHKKNWMIEIKDNGSGIPDDMKESIFNRLQRGEKDVQGSGLGLAIVREVVKGCGGKVWVKDRIKNDFSKGANFVIVLPVAEKEK